MDADAPNMVNARLDAMPVVDQANDIVMAREGCAPEGASDPLRRASQRANLKLHALQVWTCEITFAGQAGSAIRAEFDDCTVTVRPGRTTLRAQLPDQAAICGLVHRIIGLGLDVVHMHLVSPSRGQCEHRRLHGA
jgi:ANTAR domain